jgi:hypothetical protein
MDTRLVGIIEEKLTAENADKTIASRATRSEIVEKTELNLPFNLRSSSFICG